MTEPVKLLAKCLDVAQIVLGGVAVGVCNDGAQLCWLENQLASVVAQLQAMISDLESGLSIHDLGFFCNKDFNDMVEEMEVSIANLKGQIRTLREVGR